MSRIPPPAPPPRRHEDPARSQHVAVGRVADVVEGVAGHERERRVAGVRGDHDLGRLDDRRPLDLIESEEIIRKDREARKAGGAP